MSPNVISISGLLECEYFDIHSSRVNDDLRIFVGKPVFAGQTELPAIYVADGNSLFSQVLDIHRMLVWGADASPAFVIGIGYPTEQGFMQAVSKRNRDYAPTADSGFMQQVLHSPYAAGGEAFLSFIVDELRPILTHRYRIQTTASTFVGVSLSALFGTWVLLNAPQHFNSYLLTSPSLWWNEEQPWTWEQLYAAAHSDLAASVFLSAGELEHPAAHRAHAMVLKESNPLLAAQLDALVRWHDAHAWPNTAALTSELARRLAMRRYANLRIHCHIMPEETHTSVAPAAITRGLRYLSGRWQP